MMMHYTIAFASNNNNNNKHSIRYI